MALGTDAVKVLANAKVVPKNRAIGSLRSRLFPLPSGGHVAISYSPSILDVDYGLYIDLLTDVRAVCRYLTTGSYAPKVGTYRYVNDFKDMVKWVTAQYKATGKKVVVALDTETLGLDPYALEAFIVSIQATYRKGAADVIRFRSADECNDITPTLREHVKWLLTSPMVALRGANLKYDLNWIAKIWGITECTNFFFDTTLVGSLLDENRSNSLNTHAKLYTNMGGYDDEFNQKYDKSRMDLVLDDDFLTYAGGDTDACYQASEEMKALLLKDKKLTNFYNTILHPAARAYEQVERVGWCVDIPYYRHFRDELEVEVAALEKEAHSILGGRLVAKHTRKKDGVLNLGKASLLIDFMFSPSGLNLKPKMMTAGGKDGTAEKTASTSMEHLLMFKDHKEAGPLVDILAQYTTATKTLGTYVNGFLACLREDNRFHPSYFLFTGMTDYDLEGGAVTGRLSVKDPAIQTIPKHTKYAKRLRRCFIAPPGYLILSHDYSQGELKIMACLANERVMIDAYKAGLDLHSITAARLSGYTWEEFMKLKESDPEKFEEIRFLGKAGNFGLIYGMGAFGFMTYAISNYGVLMTMDQAEENRGVFFDTYPGLIPYHKRIKSLAREQQYVRSPLGRIRHLPLMFSHEEAVVAKTLRQAINSPIQSTLSDLSLWATGRIYQKSNFDVAPVFGMVHDQLLTYVPEDSWEKVATERKEIMESLPLKDLGWEPELRFTVDTEIGPSLGELKKYKPLCG